MAKHNFGYFFTGISNMFSHGFMSFAAIGITVACLLIMGVTLVAVNANALLLDLEQGKRDPGLCGWSYSTAQAKALQKGAGGRTTWSPPLYLTVNRPRRTSPPTTPRSLFQESGPGDLPGPLRHQGGGPVPAVPDLQRVREVDGDADVNAHEESLRGRFMTVRNIVTVVCVALIAILFIVSVFIISNTIKLTTFDRRDEIAIMRMVGATNGFIRWPFVYEGLMIGILGAVIAFGLQWMLYAAVAQGVTPTTPCSSFRDYLL